MKIAEIVQRAMHDRVYEPEYSTRDLSVRELKRGPHHIRHRFEFPGAISLYEMTTKAMLNGGLLKALRRDAAGSLRIEKEPSEDTQ